MRGDRRVRYTQSVPGPRAKVPRTRRLRRSRLGAGDSASQRGRTYIRRIGERGNRHTPRRVFAGRPHSFSRRPWLFLSARMSHRYRDVLIARRGVPTTARCADQRIASSTPPSDHRALAPAVEPSSGCRANRRLEGIIERQRFFIRERQHLAQVYQHRYSRPR